MALDDWLLEEAVAGRSGPVLRLYRWARPTLSVGWHQHRLEPHWYGLAAERRIDLVRRPSGGRAVLHAGCLTYALIWPQPPAADRSACYRLACGWLRAAFARLGQPLHYGRAAASQQRTSCFASSTAADLVHADGAKRIGSAQLWRRGQLLQHGSLQLSPPGGLWQELFGHPPPPLAPVPLEPSAWEDLLRFCAAEHLCGGVLEERPLTEVEWSAIEGRRSRYGLEGALVS